jgi:hypothetical protein
MSTSRVCVHIKYICTYRSVLVYLARIAQWSAFPWDCPWSVAILRVFLQVLSVSKHNVTWAENKNWERSRRWHKLNDSSDLKIDLTENRVTRDSSDASINLNRLKIEWLVLKKLMQRLINCRVLKVVSWKVDVTYKKVDLSYQLSCLKNWLVLK